MYIPRNRLLEIERSLQRWIVSVKFGKNTHPLAFHVYMSDAEGFKIVIDWQLSRPGIVRFLICCQRAQSREIQLRRDF